MQIIAEMLLNFSKIKMRMARSYIYRGRRISGRLRNPYVHMESLPCVGNKFVSFVFRSVFAAPETPTSVCFKEALR